VKSEVNPQGNGPVSSDLIVGLMLDEQRPLPLRPSIAHRLNLEWARIARDRKSIARMASWPVPALASYRSPAEVLRALEPNSGLSRDEADALLGQIVMIAQRDALAARIVLQRLIPPLVVAAVRRTRGRPDHRQAMFDDLVASAWMVIRSYPLERRPIKIAVNILRDAEYQTCVRPARLRQAGEVPTAIAPDSPELGSCELDGTPCGRAAAAAEVDEVLVLGARAGLDPTDLAMVAEVHLFGRPVKDVANGFHVSTRTVRNRRAAVTVHLAALVAA
jgi:hypothetical protein